MKKMESGTMKLRFFLGVLEMMVIGQSGCNPWRRLLEILLLLNRSMPMWFPFEYELGFHYSMYLITVLVYIY